MLIIGDVVKCGFTTSPIVFCPVPIRIISIPPSLPFSLLLFLLCFQSRFCFLNGFPVFCQEPVYKGIGNFCKSVYRAIFKLFISADYSSLNFLLSADHFIDDFLICFYKL